MLGQVCMAFKNDENTRRDFGGIQFCMHHLGYFNGADSLQKDVDNI